MTLANDLDLQVIILLLSILGHISVTAKRIITTLKHRAVCTLG